MLSQYLQSVSGIEELGIVFLLAAVTVFVGVVFYVLRLDRDQARALAALPLDGEARGDDGREGRNP